MRASSVEGGLLAGVGAPPEGAVRLRVELVVDIGVPLAGRPEYPRVQLVVVHRTTPGVRTVYVSRMCRGYAGTAQRHADSQVTRTVIRWAVLLAKPPRFHSASMGCSRPLASYARTVSTCSPGVASQSYAKARQASSSLPRSLPVASSVASCQFTPASVLTSTRSIGAHPDQARPNSGTVPAATNRCRLMKSGKPGGISSARGSIRVTAVPGSSAAERIR